MEDSVNGFYFSKFNPGNIIIIQDEGVKKPDGSPGGRLCEDATIKAETWANYGFILMCPRVFQLVPDLSGVAKSGVPKDTNIETYLSTPGAFLHEMMHFLGTDTSVGKSTLPAFSSCPYVFADC